MPVTETTYEFIENKIRGLKDIYPSLRSKSNDYVFSALAVKSHFYKNPALVITESDLNEFVVDGQYDGGVDVLLSDPNTESSDLVIGQSKFYQTISFDDVMNALTKMVLFYKDMVKGHFDQVNERVQSRFLSLHSEVGEESKIKFVFYTSAPQSGIRTDRLKRRFNELLVNSTQIELEILFGSNIVSEINESESRRPTVESGKITIDATNNYLEYGENAVIVNVSAFSIKTLYAQHNTNLLAKNLRYHITGRNIDKGIEETIKTCPETFWYKNNGLTIICDDFDVDGKEVKLKNFSIINGGQTSYMIHKSKLIDVTNEIFLPCKIIRTQGTTEEEKDIFSLEIAKATNSQKAIKPIDLKVKLSISVDTFFSRIFRLSK